MLLSWVCSLSARCKQSWARTTFNPRVKVSTISSLILTRWGPRLPCFTSLLRGTLCAARSRRTTKTWQHPMPSTITSESIATKLQKSSDFSTLELSPSSWYSSMVVRSLELLDSTLKNLERPLKRLRSCTTKMALVTTETQNTSGRDSMTSLISFRGMARSATVSEPTSSTTETTGEAPVPATSDYYNSIIYLKFNLLIWSR